ncbi:hypothetical protein EYR38_005318 [Pleurotus pulmonarius]|nr:hypothetical protein EYR38_005318 [Pleurotus pulmonarius]
MPPATRSKKALEKDVPPATQPARTTRSHVGRHIDEEPAKTTRARKAAKPVKEADPARAQRSQKAKPSGAKPKKCRNAQKPHESQASGDQGLDGTSVVSLVDGGAIPNEPAASVVNNARDSESGDLGTDVRVDAVAQAVDEPNVRLEAERSADPIGNPPPPISMPNSPQATDAPPHPPISKPHSPEATPPPIDADLLANAATDTGLADPDDSSDNTAVGPNNTTVVAAPPVPQRVKPRPIVRHDPDATAKDDAPLEYDGDLADRIRARRLQDRAAVSVVHAVNSLFDNDDANEQTPVSDDEYIDNNAEVGKDAAGNNDSDFEVEPTSRIRSRRKRIIIDDSDFEDDSNHQRKDSPRRYTAAEKGKQPQATGQKHRTSSKTFGLYADDDSDNDDGDERDIEVDESEDNEGGTKRGPFPSWALEEAQKIRTRYLDSILELAVRAKKSVAATTNLVEGKESPKKDHHWNMYQSWYGEHGPTKKPTDMKISEYTKSIVKPAYDEFLASKDDQTTLADYFEPIRKFYESAQAESNKQRQEDGNAGASVNLVTSKFQHLSQWAFLNHDVHAIGFVFSLSKDKGGSDLQNVFFGSPHMRELNNNMQSNIHQSLTDIRGELIVANTRLRRQALAPAPEAWLNQIDFSIKANGERERDRDRRVLPEILRQLANTLIESRDANDPAPKKPLKTFPWTNWANVALRYQFTMINCKDIAGMVRLWRNYKDNELNDEEADGLLRIVEWSPEEKDMDLEDQATIALVVDDSKRESLVTVRDSPDYLKAMGKRSVAQAKETAVAERQSQKGRAGRQLQKRRGRTPSRDRDEHLRLRSLPPRPAYVEIDTDNAPLADPNKPRGGAVGADAKPARKRTRDEDEDFGTLSGGERGLNRNIKKLPHRARHPSQPVQGYPFS